jgi:hypothetical protein
MASDENPLFDLNEVRTQIDAHIRHLLHSRALLPFMKDHMIGKTTCPTAPYYKVRGYDAKITFAEPLTGQKIRELNEAGHWINQGFVVRLYALLETHKIVGAGRTEWGKIRQDIDGWKDIDLLRRLRIKFAHTLGFYRSDDPEHEKLRQELIEHFSLKEENVLAQTEMFPIPIDTVLIPMGESVKRYVEALWNYRMQASKLGSHQKSSD